jgi:hypothetical protein
MSRKTAAARCHRYKVALSNWSGVSFAAVRTAAASVEYPMVQPFSSRGGGLPYGFLDNNQEIVKVT